MRQIDQSLDDAPFDPEEEGWVSDTDRRGCTWYHQPAPGYLAFVVGRDGLARLLDLCDEITHYHGAHPTRSLVMAIIRQNGGGA